jgi:hypothetical protein
MVSFKKSRVLQGLACGKGEVAIVDCELPQAWMRDSIFIYKSGRSALLVASLRGMTDSIALLTGTLFRSAKAFIFTVF